MTSDLPANWLENFVAGLEKQAGELSVGKAYELHIRLAEFAGVEMTARQRLELRNSLMEKWRRKSREAESSLS